VFDGQYGILIVPRHIGMASIKSPSVSCSLTKRFLCHLRPVTHLNELAGTQYCENLILSEKQYFL